MLVTYDRYMRETRRKILEAKLQREEPRDDTLVIPGYALVQAQRTAMKETVRYEA